MLTTRVYRSHHLNLSLKKRLGPCAQRSIKADPLHHMGKCAPRGCSVLLVLLFAGTGLAQRSPAPVLPATIPATKPTELPKETVVQAPSRETPLTPGELRFNPPTAKSVKIKWLERDEKEGNALIMVEFEGALEQRLRRSEGLRLEEFKATLRDDGNGGDEKADDGVFSALTRVDFEEIIKEAEANRDTRVFDKPIPIFEGRVKVSDMKIERFDATKFKRGAVIQIPKFPPPGPPPPPLSDISKSLMITDLSVVNDPSRTGDPCTGAGAPMGKWSFGYLMTQMANQAQTGIDPSLFVRRWLARWETAQQVNDQSVLERLQIRNKIIIPWENASGGPSAPLNLAKAPFRLLAIVNRIDLRDNFAYGGGGGSAGEARFVFCAVDSTCQPLQFTVIFEYGIKKANCTELKSWGQQWANLSAMSFGAAFNNALEAITEQFAKAGADPTRLPNRSALNQLRTNEVALAFPWQIREFTIDSTSVIGHLMESTVKQTPGPPLNHQTVIADYVNANIPTILADKHIVPTMFPGITPFLGGEAITDPPRAFWDGPKPPSAPPAIPNRDARFHFSFNTCNGCHGGETFPNGAPMFFTHIGPRVANQPSRLSSFLAGHLSGAPGPDVPVTDPADGAPSRIFNDLARRQVELQKVQSLNCKFPFAEFFFKPMRMVH
jgi:hypothetical protein